jgi:putative peptidoglycan lipid II flippase
VRDVLTASLLGTGPAADAFALAFRIPNLMRRVLGEGGLHAGVIPVEAAVLRRAGVDAARRFAGEALSTFAVALLVITILFEIAAPAVIAFTAPGFSTGEAADLATLCLRLSFPLVIGATLGSLAAALLVAQRRFGWASWSPVAVNILLVGLLSVLDQASGGDAARAAVILSAGSTAAGLVQAALVLPPLMRSARAPRPALPRPSPEIRRLVALAGPGLIVVASTQLAFLVAVAVASDIPGAVSRLHYADRVAQLPLGFVASAVGTVALPALAGLAGTGEFGRAIDRALTLALTVGLPAAVGLALLAEPVASILFERGSFTSADAAATASALAAMAIGLPFAAVARVLSAAFFARESARPPLLAALAGLAASLLSAMLLRGPFGLGGIALSIAAGAAVQCLVLLVALRAAGLWSPGRALLRDAARCAAAAAIMGVALLPAREIASEALAVESGTALRSAALVALCLGGAAVYGLAAFATGALRFSDLRRPTRPLA